MRARVLPIFHSMYAKQSMSNSAIVSAALARLRCTNGVAAAPAAVILLLDNEAVDRVAAVQTCKEFIGESPLD